METHEWWSFFFIAENRSKHLHFRERFSENTLALKMLRTDGDKGDTEMQKNI
jgi:hypothetical protein